MDILKQINKIDDIEQLETIVETAKTRMVTVLSELEQNPTKRIKELFKKAEKVRTYATDIDSEYEDGEVFTEWWNDNHCPFPCRGEIVTYDDVLEALNEDIEYETITQEEYDKFFKIVEQEIKKGYRGFVWDW